MVGRILDEYNMFTVLYVNLIADPSPSPQSKLAFMKSLSHHLFIL